MDIISVILLALVAAPLAVLSGWFVDRGYGRLGSLVNHGDSRAWWQATMPWPRGVQEEDEVRWRVHDRDGAPGPSVDPVTSGDTEEDFEMAPVRPRAQVGFYRRRVSHRPDR